MAVGGRLLTRSLVHKESTRYGMASAQRSTLALPVRYMRHARSDPCGAAAAGGRQNNGTRTAQKVRKKQNRGTRTRGTRGTRRHAHAGPPTRDGGRTDERRTVPESQSGRGGAPPPRPGKHTVLVKGTALRAQDAVSQLSYRL